MRRFFAENAGNHSKTIVKEEKSYCFVAHFEERKKFEKKKRLRTVYYILFLYFFNGTIYNLSKISGSLE